MPGATVLATEMVSVKLPGGVTELELGLAVKPAGADADRLTRPEKPPELPTVIVDVPEEPWGMLRLDGLAETEKPGDPTLTVTVTLWVGIVVENTP